MGLEFTSRKQKKENGRMKGSPRWKRRHVALLEAAQLSTRPLNWSQNQNKGTGAAIHAEERSRKRKYTLVTILDAIKSTGKAATWRRISELTLASGRFGVIGQVARKSSLVPTNLHDTTGRTPEKRDTCVQLAASVSWGAIIFRNTLKLMDWTRGKS